MVDCGLARGRHTRRWKCCDLARRRCTRRWSIAGAMTEQPGRGPGAGARALGGVRWGGGLCGLAICVCGAARGWRAWSCWECVSLVFGRVLCLCARTWPRARLRGARFFVRVSCTCQGSRRCACGSLGGRVACAARGAAAAGVVRDIHLSEKKKNKKIDCRK